MITIFNRKELLMTFDMQKQGVVRRMLVENGIKYTVDVVNLPGSFPSFEGQKTMPGSQEEKFSSAKSIYNLCQKVGLRYSLRADAS